jgi:hypothetical protein
MEEEDAELVWDVMPDGRLTASIETTGFSVAALKGNTSRE